MGHSRRRFLKTTIVTTVSLGMARATDLKLLAEADAPASASQSTLLGHIVNRIVPLGDRAGGASAGVLAEIGTKLNADPQRRALYDEGLRTVQAQSERLYSKSFQDLPADEQTALLKSLEATAFFKAVRADTIKAVYRSPEGWASIDYPGYHSQPHGYPDYHLPPPKKQKKSRS